MPQATAPGTDRGTPEEQAPERQLILIAEDEEPIAEALAMIITDAGYPAPLLAAHGQQALALARTHRPALVIADLMMPLMNGADLVRALRADVQLNGYTPHIVVMTAAGLRRAYEVEADALLRKPFGITEIEELVRRFIGPPPGQAAT